MNKAIIKDVVFGLIYNQDNLSRHQKLFNALYANKTHFGTLGLLLDELFAYRLKKRSKIDFMDLGKIDSFWMYPIEDNLNLSVRKMVYDWIDNKWGNVDTSVMLSLLQDYPDEVSNEIVVKDKIDIANTALEKLINNSEDNSRIIKTGYENIDNAFDGGFELSNMVILAGATGTGKSSVAVNMAINISEQVNVAYLMSEQDEGSTGRKFLGVLGKWKAKSIDTHDKFEKAYIAKHSFDNLINEQKLYVYNTKNRARFTVDELTTVITQLSEKGKKVFFIDNLSYIEPVYKGRRYQNYPDFIKMIVIPEINSLCSKTDSLIIVLAQVNNHIAKNKNMSIQLNDIMGGQDSVQAAYGVITIHYPFWFMNQIGVRELPKELMRFSYLKALKVRELSESSKPQMICSEGDYFRAATDDEQIEYKRILESIND